MRRNWKQWKILFSWAPKSLQRVTADMKLKDACSLEAKLSQTYNISKSRDITLLIKICLVKTMVFPVVMCGCESWTINEAEHWRTDASELWYWRRLLWCWRAPWTAKRWNQSILEEISSEYSLEGLMLKLKLWYFDHLIWSPDSLERTLMLGKIEGRRSGWQSMRWLNGLTKLMASFGSWWRTEMPGVLQSMGSQSVGHNWVTEWNYTEKS